MDLTFNEAADLVVDYLAGEEARLNDFGSALPGYVNPNIRLSILAEETEAYEFGWVFFYGSEQHIHSSDLHDSLGGNAPLLVDKSKRKLFATGTARGISYYVTNYINTGDPHSELHS